MIKWMQITSGRGPIECCYLVYKIVETLTKEAREQNLKVNALEIVLAQEPNTFKSALIAIEGNKNKDFFKSWEGTILWIWESSFRPNHKRKNWFASIGIFSPPKELFFSKYDLKIETMRSSGPGGQHVNKTNSAIRVTHLPTKLSAIAKEERSQLLNRKLALARLNALIEETNNNKAKIFDKDRWQKHNELERGNPTRIYETENFKLKNR